MLLKRCRSTVFAEVNDAVYKWYCLAISGPLLQKEALQKIIDPETQFKASNGWLDSFKRRHNIKQMTVSRECAHVQEEMVAGWLERLKFLNCWLQPEDIWNTDETGSFFQALPDKTLSEKVKECRGGKKARDRLIISFFVNAEGGREPPIIGKYSNPRG